MESPFLYDQAISAQNYLIIPFQYGRVGGYPIYSYGMLSAFGHRGAFHQATNPARLYSGSPSGILEIAQEHLAQTLIVVRSEDPPRRDGIRRFQAKLAQAQRFAHRPEEWGDRGPDPFYHRYTYRGHLMIISELRGRYVYNHYLPYELRNIAAPKLFASASECLTWIKLGIEQQSPEALYG